MGRKNSPSAKKELTEIIQRYEAAKAEKRQLYLDGDQLADIADWYATERKFNDAQEVINYELQLHPGNTGLLIEQAFLYLDTQKLSKAKEVANSITETYDSEVKMLKAELLLNEGKLEEGCAVQHPHIVMRAGEHPLGIVGAQKRPQHILRALGVEHGRVVNGRVKGG